jgi:hypothetical protein
VERILREEAAVVTVKGVEEEAVVIIIIIMGINEEAADKGVEEEGIPLRGRFKVRLTDRKLKTLLRTKVRGSSCWDPLSRR